MYMVVCPAKSIDENLFPQSTGTGGKTSCDFLFLESRKSND